MNYIFRGRDDARDSEVWDVFLDLYLFYLLHTEDVPDELHEGMNSCASTFSNLYDRNPYKVRERYYYTFLLYYF